MPSYALRRHLLSRRRRGRPPPPSPIRSPSSTQRTPSPPRIQRWAPKGNARTEIWTLTAERSETANGSVSTGSRFCRGRESARRGDMGENTHTSRALQRGEHMAHTRGNGRRGVTSRGHVTATGSQSRHQGRKKHKHHVHGTELMQRNTYHVANDKIVNLPLNTH